MTAGSKRRITIEIDEELAKAAEAVGVSIAGAVERELRRSLTLAGPGDDWAADNAEWLEAHRRYIEDNGTFGERMRGFR